MSQSLYAKLASIRRAQHGESAHPLMRRIFMRRVELRRLSQGMLPQALTFSLSLARAILARYSAYLSLWQRPPFDLLRAPLQLASQQIQTVQWHMHLHPVERIFTRSMVNEYLVQDAARIPPADPQYARQVILERITRRTQRVELPPAWGGGGEMQNVGAMSSPPVQSFLPEQRVLRRPASAAPLAASESAGELAGQMSSTGERQTSFRSAALPALSPGVTLSGSGTGVSIRGAQVQAPLDINHLTEQVVQAIDRRIIAQRERLGRF